MGANSRSRFFWLAAILAFNVSLVAGCARPQVRTSGTHMTAPPAHVSSSGFYHTVTRGQTLYRIAKLYNVSQRDLMAANGIKNAGSIEVGQQIFVPQPYASGSFIPAGSGPVSFEDAKRIIGPRQNVYLWRTITVHHSGTTQGGARNFDRNHQQRKMGGLFYHFVIGNGTATRDGEVEVGFRWKRQIKANRPYDIQICLVGNFDTQNVSEAQFATLVNLIRALQETYGIPKSAIRQHCDIPGKHTDCPGKKFPFSRLLNAL